MVKIPGALFFFSLCRPFLFFFFFLFCFFLFIEMFVFGREGKSIAHNPEKSNFCGHLGWALFFFFSGLINANAIFQWSTGDGR